MFDNGDPFDIIYLDFKKAFDQVSHKRLAVKLASYGITSKLLKWISCLLSNRLQWVKVGTSCSNKCNVTSGIPQGSILGPTLFAIYINDLPNSLTSQCKRFADDLKIYNKSFNHDIVQMDINNMLKWSSNGVFILIQINAMYSIVERRILIATISCLLMKLIIK